MVDRLLEAKAEVEAEEDEDGRATYRGGVGRSSGRRQKGVS